MNSTAQWHSDTQMVFIKARAPRRGHWPLQCEVPGEYAIATEGCHPLEEGEQRRVQALAGGLTTTSWHQKWSWFSESKLRGKWAEIILSILFVLFLRTSCWFVFLPPSSPPLPQSSFCQVCILNVDSQVQCQPSLASNPQPVPSLAYPTANL